MNTTNGLRNLSDLAADDARVEAEIERTGGNALRLGLHAYAFHADEELATVKPALALPAWFVPVTVVLVAVIIAAWGA